MSTMTFKLQDGNMSLVNNKKIMSDINKSFPISSAYVVDFKVIKKSIKNMDFIKNKSLSIAPVGLVVGVATGGSGGIFWDVFMQYIFPWLTDIAKVFCAIKIAQAFYQERRGGRDEGTGVGAFVTYGKWLLLFHLLPFGVELIDEIGNKMWSDLKGKGIQ